MLNIWPTVWISSRLSISCSSDFFTSLLVSSSILPMNEVDPIGNPSILIPSVVSLYLVYIFRHCLSIFIAGLGMYYIGEWLLVNVSILILSFMIIRSRLLASFSKVFHYHELSLCSTAAFKSSTRASGFVIPYLWLSPKFPLNFLFAARFINTFSSSTMIIYLITGILLLG